MFPAPRRRRCRTPWNRLARACVAVGMILMAVGPASRAQDTHEWIDPTGGVYGSFNNWTPIGVPAPLDTARFNLNADYRVSFIQNRQTRLLQVLNGDVVFEGSGIDTSDRTFTVEDLFISNAPEVAIEQNASGKRLTLEVTDDASVRGTLTVSQHNTFETNSAVVDSGLSASRASVYVIGGLSNTDRSFWETSTLEVGSNDNGSVWLLDGGMLQAHGHTTVGRAAGSDGEIVVTGVGGLYSSDFRSAGGITLGESGTARLSVLNGAFASTAGAVLGDSAGGRGTVTIGGTSGNIVSQWIAGNLNVKRGDVTVNRGGSLRSDGATIGDAEVSSLTLSGTGTAGVLPIWNAEGETTIGDGANANLEVQAGGRANMEQVYVGRDPGTTGRINLSSSFTETESRLFVSNNLYLGGTGFGQGGVGHLNLIGNAFARIDNRITIFGSSSVVLGPSSQLVVREIENDNGGFFDFLRGELNVRTYTGDLVNQEGTISPYAGGSLSGDGAGLMTIDGDYTQQAGATYAVDIDGEICGIGYDHIDVTGQAFLGGDLELTLLDGFEPDGDDLFDILSASSLIGSFANAAPGQRLETTDGMGSFVVNYGNTSPFNANQVILSDYLFLGADLPGDYNLNGQVEQGDLDLVLQNWGLDTTASGIPAGWLNDIPDGLIDQAELDGVLLNWGGAAAPDFTGSAVPEPASVVLLALGGLVARSRTQHR